MKLQEILKQSGVSAEQLSKKIGLPARRLSYYWTTGRVPYPIIYKIQKATGLSIDEIVPPQLAKTWEAQFDEQIRIHPSTSKREVKPGKDRPEFWFALAKWAKTHGRLTVFERNFALNMGVLISREWTPTPGQLELAARIRRLSIDEGYDESLVN